MKDSDEEVISDDPTARPDLTPEQETLLKKMKQDLTKMCETFSFEPTK